MKSSLHRWFSGMAIWVLCCIAFTSQVQGKLEDLGVPPTIPVYVCHQIPDGKITIDGKLTEDFWKGKPEIHFADLKDGYSPSYTGYTKIVWDSNYLYVAYDLNNPDVKAKISKAGKGYDEESKVMYNDIFVKFFLDPDGDGLDYMEWHVNPYNAVADLLLDMPYFPIDRKRAGLSLDKQRLPQHGQSGEMGKYWNWNCSGLKTAVCVKGTLNDSNDVDRGWSIEMAIPWDSITEYSRCKCRPDDVETWRAHIGSVTRNRDKKHGGRSYWTWPSLGVYDCHVPSRYGILVFRSNKAETTTSSIKCEIHKTDKK